VAEKKIPVSKLSFSEAVGEVESIVARLENEDIDVDELSGEVQRAIELVAACRARLERTSEEVREMVVRLQEVAPAAPAEADESA
jgi:exodeoxyribonuclease VII small subunit